MQKRLLLLVMLLLVMTTSAMAQITTSGISGKVTSQGEDVIGATVTATHVPSGTVYRAVTNIDGRYTIQGMRVGGPYKVSVAYIGQKTKTFENVTPASARRKISPVRFRTIPRNYRKSS